MPLARIQARIGRRPGILRKIGHEGARTLPVRYVIDPSRRLVITTAEGRVTSAEMRDHQNRLLKDAAFDPFFDQLIDAIGVVKLDAPVADVIALAQTRVFSTTSRRAIVAPGTAIFGMARLAQTYQEKYSDVGVFRTIDSALAWLARAGEQRKAAP